jgi:S-adenosylmethionine-dependent methyltransferase
MQSESALPNYWEQRAEEFAKAYLAKPHDVRFRVVTRALCIHMSRSPASVIDIGGGFGVQAIALARLGHSVVVLDPDPRMLDLARMNLKLEPATVQRRVELVQGHGEEALKLFGSEFNLVCCHSVLMYVRFPDTLLSALSGLVAPGGIVSILSVNPSAIGMRSGLQRRWKDACRELAEDTETERFVTSVNHTLWKVTQLMSSYSLTLKEWYGVGIFTDHLSVLEEAELDDACEAEWIAGCVDPYKSIARCYHALFGPPVEARE